jgi:threonine dehydrogenase-like Zn-dependent dehydrogenase
MTRILQTTGSGNFTETTWINPECNDNEITVQSIMTGVCRSDIDMMQGNFGPLPLNMQGHEGLGRVIKVGKNINDTVIGDYVATRGEPAYADIYNVRHNEYVVVPEAHPRYIIEPVACGINVITSSLTEVMGRAGPNSRLLLIGSGFLAYVAYQALQIEGVEFEIDVIGNSNKEIWQEIELKSKPSGTYDVVIDLVGNRELFLDPILNNQALIIQGVSRDISRQEMESLLWKACTMVYPSPRVSGFEEDMELAVSWIKNGLLNVDKFWTKGYNRDTEWQDAFADGLNRPAGYSRGYIYWNEDGN